MGLPLMMHRGEGSNRYRNTAALVAVLLGVAAVVVIYNSGDAEVKASLDPNEVLNEAEFTEEPMLTQIQAAKAAQPAKHAAKAVLHKMVTKHLHKKAKKHLKKAKKHLKKAKKHAALAKKSKGIMKHLHAHLAKHHAALAKHHVKYM